MKTVGDSRNARSLADEPIMRLILDGTMVRVRPDRKATSISLLVIVGVREDGQKVLLAVKNMGGETTGAWRTVLDDLVAPGAPGDRRDRKSLSVQIQDHQGFSKLDHRRRSPSNHLRRNGG